MNLLYDQGGFNYLNEIVLRNETVLKNPINKNFLIEYILSNSILYANNLVY